MKRKLLNLLLIILGLTLFCFGYLALIAHITAHPTDEILLHDFYKHEAEFYLLAQMQLTEKDINGIYLEEKQYYSISEPKIINGMDDPKCEKYLDLLTLMGLD